MMHHRQAATDGTGRALTRRGFLGASVAGGAALGSFGPLGSVLGRPPSAARPDANCFTKNDNARLNGLRVFQNASPPATDGDELAYKYWPCTDAAARPDFSASEWQGNKWHFVWANKAITGADGNPAPNQNPNPIQPPVITYNGHECRARYTTIAKANAATQSFIRYSLGMPNYTAPWVAAGGAAGDFAGYDDLAASPGSYFTSTAVFNGTTFQVMIDVPWLPSFRLADVAAPAPGIMLDYEEADNRTTAQSTAFLQAVANDCHGVGKQLFLYTNALNAPSLPSTGLDATNLPGLHANYLDYLDVFLWSGNEEGDIQQSYEDQIAVLGSSADYDKLVVLFELDGTTQADADTVHDILTDVAKPHPSAVIFWRAGATQGGACGSDVNDKISRVCFGAPS